MPANPLTPAAQAAEASAVDDAMLSVMSEFGPLLDPDAAPAVAGAGEKLSAQPGAVPDPAKVETPAPKQPEPDPEAPASRALLKALELDRKGQEALARAQTLERELPAKLQAETAKVKADLLAQARRDPAGFMRAVGFDKLGDVAQLLYAAELGDKAPEALRKSVKELERERAYRDDRDGLKTEIEQLRAERVAERAQAEQARYVAEYTAGLQTYVATPSDTTHTYFNRLAKSNPTRATQLLHDAAVEYATQSRGQGNALTPVQAAAAVDKLLADLAAGFGDPAASVPAPKTESRALTATAVQGRTQVRPSSATDDELTKEAMEAAMAVYRGQA